MSKIITGRLSWVDIGPGYWQLTSDGARYRLQGKVPEGTPREGSDVTAEIVVADSGVDIFMTDAIPAAIVSINT